MNYLLHGLVLSLAIAFYGCSELQQESHENVRTKKRISQDHRNITAEEEQSVIKWIRQVETVRDMDNSHIFHPKPIITYEEWINKGGSSPFCVGSGFLP